MVRHREVVASSRFRTTCYCCYYYCYLPFVDVAASNYYYSTAVAVTLPLPNVAADASQPVVVVVASGCYYWDHCSRSSHWVSEAQYLLAIATWIYWCCFAVVQYYFHHPSAWTVVAYFCAMQRHLHHSLIITYDFQVVVVAKVDCSSQK